MALVLKRRGQKAHDKLLADATAAYLAERGKQ